MSLEAKRKSVWEYWRAEWNRWAHNALYLLEKTSEDNPWRLHGSQQPSILKDGPTEEQKKPDVVASVWAVSPALCHRSTTYRTDSPSSACLRGERGQYTTHAEWDSDQRSKADSCVGAGEPQSAKTLIYLPVVPLETQQTWQVNMGSNRKANLVPVLGRKAHTCNTTQPTPFERNDDEEDEALSPISSSSTLWG